jgi:FixJ family two-component response regulator
MRAQIVFIVDDDSSVRRALQRLLSSAGHETMAFGTVRELMEAYDDSGPGCLVLDLRLPGASGLELLQTLEERRSPLGVVCISGHGDVITSVAAMKHGALDFLTKPVDGEALLSAVAIALDRSASTWCAQQERARLRQRFATLTPRERQVCKLVAAGYLNKQAAYELGTAEKTIKVHRARVMSKLEVGSLAELVRLVDRLDPASSAALPSLYAAPQGIMAVA